MRKILLILIVLGCACTEPVQAATCNVEAMTGSLIGTGESQDPRSSSYAGYSGTYKVYHSYPGSRSGSAWSDNIYCDSYNAYGPGRCTGSRYYDNPGQYRVYAAIQDSTGFHQCGFTNIFDACYTSTTTGDLSTGDPSENDSGTYLCGVSYGFEVSITPPGSWPYPVVGSFGVSPGGVSRTLYATPGYYEYGLINYMVNNRVSSNTTVSYSLVTSDPAYTISFVRASYIPDTGGAYKGNKVYYRLSDPPPPPPPAKYITGSGRMVNQSGGAGVAGGVVQVHTVTGSDCTGGHGCEGDIVTDGSGNFSKTCVYGDTTASLRIYKVSNPVGYVDGTTNASATGCTSWGVNEMCCPLSSTSTAISDARFYVQCIPEPTPGVPAIVYPTPTGTLANPTGLTGTTVTLRWTSATNADRYNYVVTNADTGVVAANLEVGAIQASFTGSLGVNYRWRVRSINDGCASSYSAYSSYGYFRFNSSPSAASLKVKTRDGTAEVEME